MIIFIYLFLYVHHIYCSFPVTTILRMTATVVTMTTRQKGQPLNRQCHWLSLFGTLPEIDWKGVRCPSGTWFSASLKLSVSRLFRSSSSTCSSSPSFNSKDDTVIKTVIECLGSAVVWTRFFSDEVRHVAEDVISRRVRAGLVTGLSIGSRWSVDRPRR